MNEPPKPGLPDLPSNPRIAILGTGALAGYYGSRLLEAGADVAFIGRSSIGALHEHGWIIQIHGDKNLRTGPVRAALDPHEIGTVDLVIIALKSTGNEVLHRWLPPLLHEGTRILTLQNGLGPDEEVANIVGPERVLAALCFICTSRMDPGVVECLLPGRIVVGEFNRPLGSAGKAIAELFVNAGVETETTDDLAEARWRKLVWNVPFNGLSVVGGSVPTDRILENPQLLALTRDLMEEVCNGARAHGYIISPDFPENQIESTRLIGSYKPSSLVDYLQGTPLEVEPIWGEPCRRSQAAGVNVPKLEMLYRLLKAVSA